MAKSQQDVETKERNAAGDDAADQAMQSLIDRAHFGDPERRAAADASLLAICRAMGAGLTLDEVLSKILSLSLGEMAAAQGSILLFDEAQDQLRMLASIGLPEEIVSKGYISRKGSIAEWVIENKKPLILSERAKSGEFTSLDDKRRIVSSMCIPLLAPGGILGTINLNRTDPNVPPFVQADLDRMVILASQAAIYIENSKLHEANLKRERLAAIGQTVAGISHCVKNLVTGMKGGVSLSKMARKHTDWETQDQAMEVLEHSVQRISNLVLDMLEYSKDREPDLSDVDLDELLKEIKGVTRTKAAEQGTALQFDLAPDARIFRADGHRLFRCLLNLIENALDATREGGKVTVKAIRKSSETAIRRLGSPAPAAITISISDEGPGISADNHARLFEPFFSTKGSKGTGLGLAVTHKIIAEHGGSLELASAPGEPAVFNIHLPG